MTYALATLGDAFSEPSEITAWRAAVRARGNTDVIAPTGAAFVGQLAERIASSKVPAGMMYPSPAIKLGTFWYVPAPAGVQEAWRGVVASDAAAKAAGAFVDNVQSIPGTVVSDAGKLARTAVTAVTGIPSWAIPVLIIGGGAFILMSAAHSFLPDRRR